MTTDHGRERTCWRCGRLGTDVEPVSWINEHGPVIAYICHECIDDLKREGHSAG